MSDKPKNKEVAHYYDNFWVKLKEKKQAGVNSRHRTILYNLKKAGLKKNSVVLEVGCGNGVLTSFISKYIPKGKIVATDISPNSIKFARNEYKNKHNIEFILTDMSDFSYPEKFDFIVLPDVIEHIPVENHLELFRVLRNLMHEHSIILINIPSPYLIEWLHKEKQEALQIIDQPIYTDELLKNVYSHGLYIESLKSYSLFHETLDYQLIVLKPYKAYNNIKVKPQSRVLFNGILLRIKTLLK